MTETLRLAIQKGVRRRATVIAAIVGPVIALINHGDAIIGGYMEGFDWMKVCLTFLVPYLSLIHI